MEHLLSKNCLKFGSRQDAYEQLMEALKNDQVKMIGLWGMGGCGKTTVAMELKRISKVEHLVDEVVFVPVSSKVEVGSIQDKIASELGFQFTETGERQRAQRLCKRLTLDNLRTLVILDDVWQLLDLVEIGIPFGENRKNCKVLITTRSKTVCTQMDCQITIYLPILTDEEAWGLFQKQACISEGTSDAIKHLGQLISIECKGLPVAVAALAGTLKGKTEDHWKVTLDRLRSSIPLNIDKGLQNPYKCLQISYDNLDDEKAKSLFLLCSVFPEDYEIFVDLLTIYAIGLGLVAEVRSFEAARNEVSVAKDKLISSSLLLLSDVDKDELECVKMHDLVRDVGHSIARNESKVVKCASKNDVTAECSSIRYLWCEEFSDQLDCSSIEFLCIETSSKVSDEIFKAMGRLGVLILCWQGESLSVSTMSFKSLTDLRVLFLVGWELSDVSSVRYMKKLESLVLYDCSIFELPDVVITELTNLRLLRLFECDIKSIPFEVIGRHPHLEELYIDDYRSKWDLYDECTTEFFSKFSVPQALQRFEIRLGTVFSGYQEQLLYRGRALFLSCFDTSNAAIKNLAKKAEILCIANIHGGAKNIIPDIFQIEKRGGMNYGWIELMICDSEDIERLVDTGKHLSEVGTLLSELCKLTIERMKRLGCLYHGWHQSGLFEKLKELYIEDCPQLYGTLFDWKLNLCSLKVLELDDCPELTSVFTPAAARSVVHLEKLKILDCDGLKHVLADDDSRDEEETSNDDRRLVFPKLKLLTVTGCKNIGYIIPVTFARGLRQLECLEIEVGQELKYVFGPCKLGANQSQNELNIELPLLEKLALVDLPNIITICRNCYTTCPSLNRFTLRGCPEFAIMSVSTCVASSKGRQCDHITTKIKCNDTNIRAARVMKDRLLSGIFQVAEGSIDGEQDPLANCLQNLGFICNALMQSMNLQNLEQMEVSGSKGFSSNQDDQIYIYLPQLKKFMGENCNEGDQIFIDEDGEHHHFMNLHLESKDQLQGFPESTSIPSAPLVNYNSGPYPCNLKRLVLRSCSMPRTLFSPSTAIRLTSLEELIIAECHGLRYIVTSVTAHENEEEIIPEDHDSQSYASMFPRLKRIGIMNCNLLEHMLHVSFAQGLVELKEIEIRHTPQLRYIFGENVHDHLHSSNQYQGKVQVELPLLGKLALFSIPNMVNICPDNYHVTCSSLQRIVMNDVGLSTLSVNNLMVRSGYTHSGQSRGSTLDIGAASKTNGQVLGSVSIWNSSKIRGIFHVDGFHVNGPPVTSWLMYLNLVNLEQLQNKRHFSCGRISCQRTTSDFMANVLELGQFTRAEVHMEGCQSFCDPPKSQLTIHLGLS